MSATGHPAGDAVTAETLALCEALVSRPSVTPHDRGCQALLAERLSGAGFRAESMDRGGVSNVWLRHGTEAPLFVFAGHTDVVPPGPESAWSSPPFTPTRRDGYLFGRGTADMKGSIAAFITAAERFCARVPGHRGSVAMLITSDEEGPATDGTVHVVEQLNARGVRIDWCLVGEPSSTARVGDVVRNGRRGSLNADLQVRGVQGHVAYPHAARNPIHDFVAAMSELSARRWDEGNAYFPATSFQITNVSAGTGADNVIPATLQARLNWRYSTCLTRADIEQTVAAVLDRHGVEHELVWRHSGGPFLTEPGALVEAVNAAVHGVTGARPQLSTGGGTSDGRFIAPTGAQVVELGPVNATIHALDECVRIAELGELSRIYEAVLTALLPDA